MNNLVIVLKHHSQNIKMTIPLVEISVVLPLPEYVRVKLYVLCVPILLEGTTDFSYKQ